MARTTNNNINQDMYTELSLYAINTSKLYYSCIIPVCKNLAHKQVKGIYNKEKALKAFYNVVIQAQKAFFEEFSTYETCANASKWHKLANVATRKEVASYLLDYYADYIEEIADELSNK